MSDQPETEGDDAGEPASPSGGDLATRIAARASLELARWLAEPLAPGLYLVATPIGNLGDITIRALAVLARADLVCCEDTRHSRTLLSHFAIDRPLRAYHEHNADAERPRLLAMLAKGRAVALISDAGTPLVSDPGYKLVRACLDAGHRVTSLPGASAVMAAIAMSGLPTDQFHFAGFLPSRDGQRHTRLVEIAAIAATVVLFEAPGRLSDALAAIADVMGADRPVAVARELTKRYEELRRGTAAEVAAWAAAEPQRGEIVILIGPPPQRVATDAEIEAALVPLLPEIGLKEAAKAVAARLDVPRTRAYDIGLAVKDRSR